MYTPTLQEGPNWDDYLTRMRALPTSKLRQIARNIARWPERSIVDLEMFQVIDAILEERRRV